VTLELIDEAVVAGARLEKACELLGLSARTIERWRREEHGGRDRRAGPHRAPAHELTEAERAKVLEIASSAEFRDKSPRQIVPTLADRGEYVASESSFYRVLKAADQLAHRGRARRPGASRPKELVASGPNRVWCWDITYLRSSVRGAFYYLYLVVDVYSRKIVGWTVESEESQDFAVDMIDAAIRREGMPEDGLVLHADNGGPMKGSTMLATLQRLGASSSSFSSARTSATTTPFMQSRCSAHSSTGPRYPQQALHRRSSPHAPGSGLRRLVQRRAPAQRHPLRHPERPARRPGRRHPGRPDQAVRPREEARPASLVRQDPELDPCRPGVPQQASSSPGKRGVESLK
jgi:putative transposase